jgi:hypothetical protein
MPYDKIAMTFRGVEGGSMTAVEQLVAGRYRIIRSLGAGGMGRVWLAADEKRGGEVALKRCSVPDGLSPAEQELCRRWTLREARAFTRVHHPHVIRTYDVLPDGDAPWIVMEYLPATSLLEIITTLGPLSPRRTAEIGLAVLDGLNAIGRAGLLHLDVKPSNVLIAEDGRVVLTDFGPVVTHEGVGALAGAGIILGSPNYVAPERLFDGVSTAQADLWSLGATLYHAVEGHPPLEFESVEQTLRALAQATPEPPRRAGPLAPVLTGLLRRDPAARLSAEEVEERLRRVAEPPRPAALRTRIRPRARRTVAVFAAAVAVAAVAGLAVNAQHGEQTPARTAPSRPVFASNAPVVLPAGFGWWNDPHGFRVGVPTGWRAERGASGAVQFSPPSGGPSLRIFTWTPTGGDVLGALVAREQAVRLADYRRIKIEAEASPYQAVWEYVYRDPDAGAMHGMQRIFRAAGRAYVIEWQTPEGSWTNDLQKLTTVLNSFALSS